jgi:predicted DNA-binding transcriptional regulator AlpA
MDQPTTPTRFLDNREAAAFLNLSPRTLEKMRVEGSGPRFHKFGSRVRYAVVDLERWANARAYDSTSDASSGSGR